MIQVCACHSWSYVVIVVWICGMCTCGVCVCVCVCVCACTHVCVCVWYVYEYVPVLGIFVYDVCLPEYTHMCIIFGVGESVGFHNLLFLHSEMWRLASEFTLDHILSRIHCYRSHSYLDLVAIMNVLPEFIKAHPQVRGG